MHKYSQCRRTTTVIYLVLAFPYLENGCYKLDPAPRIYSTCDISSIYKFQYILYPYFFIILRIFALLRTSCIFNGKLKGQIEKLYYAIIFTNAVKQA